MAKFNVAVSWEMYGVVTVEAKCLEDAIRIAEEDETIPLPDGDYVDGSFRADADISFEMN